MRKRKAYNPSEKLTCKICSREIAGTGFPSHIKTHNMEVDQYVEMYGEFRKNKQPLKGTRTVRKVQCKICEGEYTSVGMSNHLLDTHDISVDEYVANYEEFRLKYLAISKRMESFKVECVICKEHLPSEFALGFHVPKVHGISKEDYVKKYVLKGETYLCKCGCGQEVNILTYPPYKRDYMVGHQAKHANPMTGVIHTESAKELMRSKAIARVKRQKQSDTVPEKQFKLFLESNKIKYIHQYETEHGAVDFYLPEHDLFVEIDGEWWHPLKKEHLTIRTLSGAISDLRKSNIKNMFRIGAKDVEKITNLNDLETYNREFDFTIGYRQKVIDKEYFRNYIDTKGKKQLEDSLFVLSKFIREYQPDFPTIETRETLTAVVESIRNYDLDLLLNNKNEFRNNTSNVGVSYLKANFKSYWNSAYKGTLSPVEAWKDEAIMRKVIKYRIGCNESNEVFDFSLHQMVRGLSALRHTVSFFKPIVAASIYKHFLGDTQNPTVFDPSSGFGGRLLGFKALYPNGKYIGIEPNKDTYLELKELSKNFTNVELHNCKLEDFNQEIEYDLAFTSIPYFDLETYSQPVEYDSFKTWTDSFIKTLKSYDKLVVNVPLNFEELFPNVKNRYYLVSNSNHFNKKSNEKRELIIEL
jgi:hypothetical protein